MQNQIQKEDERSELFSTKMVFSGLIKKPKGFLLSIFLILTGLLFSMECAPSGTRSASTTSKYKSCTLDTDCGEGDFCFTKNLEPRCETCYDCKHYDREAKYPCAKSRKECGNCLPGFQERTHPITGYECYEIPAEQAHLKTDNAFPWGWASIVAALTIIALVVISLVTYFVRRRYTRNSEGSHPDNVEKKNLMSIPSAPMEPPQYDSDHSQSYCESPPAYNPHFQSAQNQNFKTPCAKSSYQQANPFALGTSWGPEAEHFMHGHHVPEVGDAMQPNNDEEDVADLFAQALEAEPAQPEAEVPEVEELNEDSMELQPWEDNMDVEEAVEEEIPGHQYSPEYAFDLRLELNVVVRPSRNQNQNAYAPQEYEQVVPDMNNNAGQQTSGSVEIVEIIENAVNNVL